MDDITPVPSGLREWAALSGPARVLAEVRRRARNGNRTESGTLRLPLTEQERREVARLAGTRWEVSGRPVRLGDLAAALAEHGVTVRGFVEALDGRPLELTRELRANEAARRENELTAARSALVAAGLLERQATLWLTDPAMPRPGDGTLLALAEAVAAVWPHLDGSGRPRRLAEVAAAAFGDAHALDPDRHLGRAAARLLAVVHALERPVRGGVTWRTAWAAGGVLCDEVSSRVLTLNLPLAGESPAARLATATPGEPVWLTLRSLDGQLTAPSGLTVFVCENVTVVEAAADRWGPGCAPLVCTDGMPSLAALTLLRVLAACGCQVRVRADIDEAGFIVVDQVRSAAPESSGWRYDVAHYGRTAPRTSELPEGPAGAERTLREVWQEVREPLHEEALLELLLADLAPEPTRSEPEDAS